MSEVEDLLARIAELEAELAECDCSHPFAPFYASTKVLNSEWIKAEGPAAVYFPALNKTVVSWYMVGNGSEKGAQVAAYDHSTSTWSERYKVLTYTGLADDDHGQCSLCQDADGYFYVFCGSHASVQQWAISTRPNDISGWTKQTQFTGMQTYPHACTVGSKIYLFLRSDANTSTRQFAVRVATPSAGNAFFSGLTALIDLGPDSRAYMSECHVIGTDVHFSGTRANAADTYRKGIYYFIYDTLTGAIRNHDSSVVVPSGSLPVSLATANASFKLYDPGSGRGDMPSLCFDTSGNPHIIFADNGGSGEAYKLKYITKSAGVWSTPVNVDDVYPRFLGIGSVVTYASVPGDAGKVEAWYCNFAGDKIRRVVDSGVWEPAETILKAASSPLIGSQAVRNADPGFRSIFCEVSNSFSDANAVVSKRYGYGDAGPIEAVIPMTAQDPIYSNVSVLLGFDHRNNAIQVINDADTCLPLTAFGNAKVDSGTLLLDGTGDYLNIPSNTLLSVGNGDFCIEAIIRKAGASRQQTIASKRPPSGSSEWACYVNANNLLAFQAFNSTVAVVALTGTTVLDTTSDYHVAFTRQGSTWRMFLNGVLEASQTETSAPTTNTQLFYIGRCQSSSARDFNGRMSQFRFTSGNSRYTSDFLPPTTPFPRR